MANRFGWLVGVVLAAMRERAARRQVVAAAAAERPSGTALEPVALHTVQTDGTSSWPREELYDDTGR